MQVCTLLQTDNHANTSPLSFLQAGCPSCRPTNSVKALKAFTLSNTELHYIMKTSDKILSLINLTNKWRIMDLDLPCIWQTSACAILSFDC